MTTQAKAQLTLTDILENLAQDNYNQYADFDVITNYINTQNNASELIKELNQLIDQDYNHSGKPTIYSAVMKYCMEQIKNDFDYVMPRSANYNDTLHSTNFEDTQEFGNILNELGSANQLVQGQGIVDTIYDNEFSMMTYDELLDKLLY